MTLNLDQSLERLYKGEILSELAIKEVCERLKESLVYQSNITDIQAPVTVVGDLHGFAA
jgi:serine/threonine-protein phosphatase PPG1